MAETSTSQLNIRVPKTLLQELEQIAEMEQVDRTAIARKLLSEGVKRWRLERALELCARGQISKERAAEMAGVTLYDIMDELRRRGTSPHYSLDDLREDLALLRERDEPTN
jgi:predicted HTH domain antitoxin